MLSSFEDVVRVLAGYTALKTVASMESVTPSTAVKVNYWGMNVGYPECLCVAYGLWPLGRASNSYMARDASTMVHLALGGVPDKICIYES